MTTKIYFCIQHFLLIYVSWIYCLFRQCDSSMFICLVGYLACARCSSTGALVLTEPVSTFSDGDQPLSAPKTERCPNCSGSGKVIGSFIHAEYSRASATEPRTSIEILIAHESFVKNPGDVSNMPLHWDGNGKRAWPPDRPVYLRCTFSPGTAATCGRCFCR
jgi:hypothetical protein